MHSIQYQGTTAVVLDFQTNSLGAQEHSYVTDQALDGGVVSSGAALNEQSFEGQAVLLGTGVSMSRTPLVEVSQTGVVAATVY